MKTTILEIAVGLAVGAMRVAVAADATGAAQAPAPITLQKLCPVMGGKVNRDLYVDYEGKRVYVCCKGCIDTLMKDPAKYIKQLEAEGVTVATLQSACPVMGGKVNKDLYVDYEGKRIYVCCQGCIGPLKKDPARYVEAMEKAGVALEATPGTAGGK